MPRSRTDTFVLPITFLVPPLVNARDCRHCGHVAIRFAIVISKMVDAPQRLTVPLGRVTAPDLRNTILNCTLRSVPDPPARAWHLTCPFTKSVGQPTTTNQQTTSCD